MAKTQVLGEGPEKADIVIVGMAPGNQELKKGRPFVGGAGKELDSWLQRAGLNRASIYITNVFKEKPPNDDIGHWSLPKKEAQKKLPGYDLPAIKSGAYLDPDYLWVLEELRQEIEIREPNLIIALGNVATWAILGQTKITKIRGTLAESTLVPGIKVLPTLHPAGVLRNYSQRPVAMMDILVAAQESTHSEIIVPEREIWIDPTVQDLAEFQRRYLEPAWAIAVDIETWKNAQVSHVGFSTADAAISVPFIDSRNPGLNYWPEFEDEVAAWYWVRDICSLPQPKVMQNGNFDLYWLWSMGIPVRHYKADDMILHHALYPEIQKDLGFLGSIYSNLRMEWKSLSRNPAKEQG